MKSPSVLRRTPAALAITSLAFSSAFALQLPVFAAPVAQTLAACSVSTAPTFAKATTTWGIKASFTNYISKPFVQGGWQLTDVTESNHQFTWSNGTGTWDPSTKTGEISFPGSIRFTGHEGKLDLTFKNVRIKINGTQGEVVVDADSKEFKGFTAEGDMKNYTNVVLATLDLQGLKVTGTDVSVSGAQATLTDAGSSAFGGFYKSGQVLDALSFSAPLTPGTTSAPCSTTAEVSNAAQADGLTISINGSNYDHLPNASTGKPSAGFYIAVVPADLDDAAINPKNPLAVKYVRTYDKNFTETITVPTAKLTKNGAYKVVVWVAHGTVTDNTRLYSGKVDVSDAQWDALFPAPPTPAPTTVAPTAAPTSVAPTSAPTTAAPTAAPTTVAPTSAPTTAAPTAAPTTAAPTAAPTSAAPTTPAPAPTATAPSSAREVTSGDLAWGIRDSFRKYLTGPIAQGSWTLDGVTYANGAFSWANATGSYSEATKTGEIAYAGSLHFVGHDGKLDMTFSNIRVQIIDGKGYLVADADTRAFSGFTSQGELKHIRDVVLANVDLSNAVLSGDTISVSGAPATLTAAGAEAFGGFYTAGAELSPLTFTAHLGKTVSTVNAPTNSGSGAAGTSNTTSGSHGAHTNVSSASAAPATSHTATTKATGSATPSAPVCVKPAPTASASKASAGTVNSGSLSWGLKTSFRNYIQGGIAQGGWTLSSVEYAGGAFSFSDGTGSFDGTNGRVSFPGSIHFTGHNGILNTTISNLEVQINGNSGVLWANVTSNDMSGKETNYGKVQFATIDLSKLQVSSGSISVKGAATSLTEAGAKAFAGFYNAGQELDPLTFSATRVAQSSTAKQAAAPTASATKAQDCATTLPRTGPADLTLLAPAGLAAILAGGIVQFASRRRATQD